MKKYGKDKLPLHGFNNLTKSLSFNIFDISYARSREGQSSYIEYIDELYCSDRLCAILQGVADIVGARVLNVASQDYDPQGASVTMLVEEGYAASLSNVQPVPSVLVGHLDKSHITVHTYPEQHPVEGISTFRADVDVATCGRISPLQALDFLIGSFESDILTLDYRVRGFTRTTGGEKLFIDHEIASIQEFISEEILANYVAYDDNHPDLFCFHTRLRKKNLLLDDFLFENPGAHLSTDERSSIGEKLEKEIEEIFQYGGS